MDGEGRETISVTEDTLEVLPKSSLSSPLYRDVMMMVKQMFLVFKFIRGLVAFRLTTLMDMICTVYTDIIILRNQANNKCTIDVYFMLRSIKKKDRVGSFIKKNKNL